MSRRAVRVHPKHIKGTGSPRKGNWNMVMGELNT